MAGRTGEEIFGEDFDTSLDAPDLGLQLSGALRTMHRAGISHNDLHIGNWIATPTGVKVIDWGTGSRAKADVLTELGDAGMWMGFGISYGPSGQRKAHPAVCGYDDLAAETKQRLASGRSPRSWRPWLMAWSASHSRGDGGSKLL